jgi:type I restriction enzyme S subunit
MLSDVINQMPKADFTFDELRQASSANYESLKDELFALLADANSGIEQFFDTDARTMKLRRTRK